MRLIIKQELILVLSDILVNRL